MITISLDEYGDFEKDGKAPLFIGGIIFDDQEEKEEECTERKRIEAYYKKAIEDAGKSFKYPNDLHSNGDKDRDHSVIRQVKKKVSETLPEFIAKGTYNESELCDKYGKPIQTRKGKYHIFVMLKSDDGKKSLLSKNANMLANDDWAANRYFHMASSVVNRIIFHNPLYKRGCTPAINIDIATRSTGNIDSMDDNLENQFKKQAYRVNKRDESNYTYYSIMNADIYRTLIAQEMVNSDKVYVNIEKLYVRSITYDSSKKNMEFLYLSDSICSVLGYHLENNGNSADDCLTKIIERVSQLNPDNENLIFGYDEVDNYFAKAWNLYEQYFLYEALSVAYDVKLKKGKFAELYNDVWFPYLEKRIRENITPEIFYKSVNYLSAMLTINNLDQEKLVYLLEQFDLMAEKVSDKFRSIDMKSSILYKLYDAGVTAFCHIGNSTKALEYYDKCTNYAFYVGLDAYMRTNNNLVVCLEDSFEWEKAVDIALENVSNQQLASDLKRSILESNDSALKREFLKSNDSVGTLDEAKAISHLARIYAELRDERAEKYFRDALDKLEKGSANYKITQSYLLHYYADMGMKEKFDEEALDYFDEMNTYNQRLKYILRLDENLHSVFSREYALYVLIRGLFCFHKEDIKDDNLWEKLRGLDETLTNITGKAPSGHPWEITYKYLEMMAIYRKDDNARNEFSRLKRERLSRREGTIKALDKFGDAEVADFEKNDNLRDSITKELAIFVKTNFDSLKDVDFSVVGSERYQQLQKYFTFMYH